MRTIHSDEAFELLARFDKGAKDKEGEKEQPEKDSGEVKSMAEILAQGQEAIKEESVASAEFETLHDMIFVFRLIHNDIRSLDQLGNIDIEKLRKKFDDGETIPEEK